MNDSLSLRTSVLRGLGWLTGAQGARQALQVAVRVLLARLLSPDDFGLVAMVTVVSGFLLMFNDLGFGPALVRKEQVTEDELSSIFWITALTGVLLAFVTAAMEVPLARLYRHPTLVAICVGLAPGSLAMPLGTVPSALLQRRLAFRSLAIIDVAGIAAGGAVGALLAATGHGVWALVWQSNTTALVVLLVTWAQAGWMPRPHFHAAAPAGLWRFSSHFTAATVLNYWVRNLDNLLVGAFLGSAALGLYSLAYQMMLYPVQNIAALTGRVMFPALASVQADPERFQRAYVRALRGIAALTIPLMLGAMVLAPDVYAVLFGPRWARSVPLFQILCTIGMIQSIGTTIGWIYMSTGRTDLQLRWTIFAAAIVFPSFVAGLRWGGLEGLTVAYALASSALFIPSLLVGYRLISLYIIVVALRLAPLLIAGIATAAAMAALRWSLLPVAGVGWRVLLGVLLGGAAYPIFLQLLGQAPLVHARALWRTLLCR